jgi:hypothetical protein
MLLAVLAAALVAWPAWLGRHLAMACTLNEFYMMFPAVLSGVSHDAELLFPPKGLQQPS